MKTFVEVSPEGYRVIEHDGAFDILSALAGYESSDRTSPGGEINLDDKFAPVDLEVKGYCLDAEVGKLVTDANDAELKFRDARRRANEASAAANRARMGGTVSQETESALADGIAAAEAKYGNLLGGSGAPEAPESPWVTGSGKADGESPKQTVASRQDGPLVRIVQALVVNRVRQRTGASTADVESAISVAENDSGRPLLDWIANGGLQHLIEIILSILALLPK